jgi:hypothetical protein
VEIASLLPLTLIVLHMGQDGANMRLLSIVEDRRDQPGAIVADVADRQIAHVIRAWKSRPQFSKRTERT